MLAEERGNIECLLTAVSTTLNRDLPVRLQVGGRGLPAWAAVSRGATNGVVPQEPLRPARHCPALTGPAHCPAPSCPQEAVRGELAGMSDSLAAAVAPAVQAALGATLPKEVAGAVRSGLDKQLAPAVAAGLSGKPVQEAFRTAFSKQLLPAFEGATQQMFQQINSAVTAGLDEHLQVGGGQGAPGWAGGCEGAGAGAGAGASGCPSGPYSARPHPSLPPPPSSHLPQATRAALGEPAKLSAQLAASLSSAQSLAASLNQGQQQLIRAQSGVSTSGVRR